MQQIKNSLINLVQQQVWGILPEWLDLIHNILYAHYFGNGIDLQKVEAEAGRKFDNKFEVEVRPVLVGGWDEDDECSSREDEGEIPLYDVQKTDRVNVAVIPVHGIIAKRMNLFQSISGGTSTELLKLAIRDAIDNPNVDAIVLDTESPGGTADSVKELADFIYEQRGIKPMLAHANGLMASAAYWIGSAVDIVTAYDSAQVGSIGVITSHYDYSKADEMEGVKRTFIYAGKYKAMGNDAEPLSKTAKDYFQQKVDDIYTMFVTSIARNRGKDIDYVLKNMADGKIFLAEEAQKVGLIDERMDLEQTINLAATMVAESKGGSVKVAKEKTKEVNMDIKELQEKHPELYQEVYDLSKADAQKIADEKVALLQAIITDRQATILNLDTQIEALTAESKKLDKDLTILQATMQTDKEKAKVEKDEAQAEAIVKSILADSNVQEVMYSKIKIQFIDRNTGHLDLSKYRTEAGEFDAPKFEVAFRAEVTDWEGIGSAGPKLGAGAAKDDPIVVPFADENKRILATVR